MPFLTFKNAYFAWWPCMLHKIVMAKLILLYPDTFVDNPSVNITSVA